MITNDARLEGSCCNPRFSKNIIGDISIIFCVFFFRVAIKACKGIKIAQASNMFDIWILDKWYSCHIFLKKIENEICNLLQSFHFTKFSYEYKSRWSLIKRQAFFEKVTHFDIFSQINQLLFQNFKLCPVKAETSFFTINKSDW